MIEPFPVLRRDRVAVALCNFILRRLASERYRRTLDVVVREGMRGVAR